jgi:hypothetical protein
VSEVYFHEDDYCQVEVLPIENFQFCRQQAGDIESFSHEHEVGAGWDDVYVRSSAPKPLVDIGLQLVDVRAALAPHCVEATAVFTGYGSHREKCEDVFAFVASDGEKLFLHAEEGLTVSAVWLSDLTEHILHLPRRDALLLVDWRHGFVCPLSDVNRLNEFLHRFD